MSPLGTPEEMRRLAGHEKFDLRNPNRVRALVSSFAPESPYCFHDASGDGYRFLADTIIALDPSNGQVAARMVSPLGQWRRVDAARQALMQAEVRSASSTRRGSHGIRSRWRREFSRSTGPEKGQGAREKRQGARGKGQGAREKIKGLPLPLREGPGEGLRKTTQRPLPPTPSRKGRGSSSAFSSSSSSASSSHPSSVSSRAGRSPRPAANPH